LEASTRPSVPPFQTEKPARQRFDTPGPAAIINPLPSAAVFAEVLTMIVELSSIGTSAKPINITIGDDQINLDGDNLRLAGPAAFRGDMQRVDGRPHIRGMLVADIETSCSRCLELLERHLEIAFDDVFVDASEEPTAAEAEVAETELDESLVIGGHVDMSEVVREQILLAMPEQVYCKDDCKGLCPKCGENRNLIDCTCADNDVDPRWAALRDLR